MSSSFVRMSKGLLEKAVALSRLVSATTSFYLALIWHLKVFTTPTTFAMAIERSMLSLSHP